MALKLKFSIGASVFWPPKDRTLSSGYKPDITRKEIWESFSKVEGLEGVELYYPSDFDDPRKIKKILDSIGLEVCSVGAIIWAPAKYQNGSVTSLDKSIRRDAIEISKKAMDFASMMGASAFNFWPAQDGYDYYFQSDYQNKWDLLVDGVKEIASVNPEMPFGIEYKAKEPRTHQIISNASNLLLLAADTGLDNVGATMDFGHSIICGENPAAEVVQLINRNRLALLHNNDNYADWDHDMLPATAHFWENMEFFYWLKRLDYSGWINFDIFPVRFDAIKASTLTIKNIKRLIKFIEKIDVEGFNRKVDNNEVLETQEFLWGKLFDR